jgi:hypothetical protein
LAYLTLIAGLLLPWITGAAWMGLLEARFGGGPGVRARAWGYGFFIGYAALGLLLLAQSAVTGQVSWGPPMLALAVVAAAGWWFAKFVGGPSGPTGILDVLATPVGGPSGPTEKPNAHVGPEGPPTRAAKWLIGVLLAWAALHLVRALIDQLAIPVYPWDAWLLWLYRAKAWFFAGNVFDFYSAAEWLKLADAGAYTVDAVGYPPLPSIFPLWAALSYGEWSETLVNLPALLCGIALGLALYGQCRRAGAGLAAGVIAVYLLYATPLVGTHLATPGYADLWMAGFAGLGFLALLQGRLQGSRYQALLGLLLAATGLLVKNEGVVWFVAFLVLWFMLTVRWWVSLALAVGLAALAVAAWRYGVDPVALPFGQSFSIVGDRVTLPFIKPFALKVHAIGAIYTHGFFEMDTWNLLWTLMAATAAAALLRVKRPESRTVLVFLAVFAATQLFIFGLTQHGAYGETYTASNRLPLHFLPALLFGAVVVLGPLLREAFAAAPDASRWRRAVPPVLAAVLVLAAAWSVVTGGDGEAAEAAEPLAWEPAAFRPIVGAWQTEGEGLVLTGLQDGFGAASVQGARIDAATHYLLHFEMDAPEDTPRPVLFWRAEGQQDVTQLDLWDVQSDFIDLRGRAGWAGTVVELGLLFRNSGDEPITIRDVRLGAETPKRRLQVQLDQWFQPEPWTVRSVNFRNGGAKDQTVYLPALLAAWFALTLLLGAILLRGDRAALLRMAALVFLAGWLILDLRWSANRWALADEALADISLSEQEKFAKSWDGDLFAFLQGLKQKHFDADPGRILLLNDGSVPLIYELKAKYLLLPREVGQGRGAVPPEWVDGVKFVLAMTLEAEAMLPRLQAGDDAAWRKLRLPPQRKTGLRLVDAGPFGFLFRVVD